MKQIIKLMGSFRNRKDARTLGLEIVLIYHYLTLVTFSHVGKESAVDFNFWPTKQLSLNNPNVEFWQEIK